MKSSWDSSRALEWYETKWKLVKGSTPLRLVPEEHTLNTFGQSGTKFKDWRFSRLFPGSEGYGLEPENRN